MYQKRTEDKMKSIIDVYSEIMGRYANRNYPKFTSRTILENKKAEQSNIIFNCIIMLIVLASPTKTSNDKFAIIINLKSKY